MGAEPDPEAVRRLMEKVEREAAEEAAKKAPAPKPRPKPEPAPKPAPAVDHDREAWRSAEKCGTAACFEVYLADYPNGRYARMARARLAPKSETPPEAAERPSVPSRPVQALLADRYRDHGDGTVTDVKTGLQWMRCSMGQTWQSGTCVGKAQNYTWQASLKAADPINSQDGYAGYRDWRVPRRKELLTLVYCSSGWPKTWNDTGISCEGDFKRPTLYQPAFPNTLASWYWSSSEANAPSTEIAWSTLFDYGNNYAGFKHSYGVVRLVLGGQ